MILAQSVGTCQVFFVTIFPLAAEIPVEVAEADLLILGNGLLDRIHIIVDGLIHALDPAGDKHRTAHQLGILLIALGAQLFNQLPGFLFR